jgi:hypothetical protein
MTQQQQQREPMTAAELHEMLKDPNWFRKISAKDIGYATGPVLTEAQFRELQARKRAQGAAAPTVFKAPDQTVVPPAPQPAKKK